MSGVLQRLFGVEGKQVVVTGGSRGIGEMIARGFVEAGADVFISARKADACDATAAELDALHRRFVDEAAEALTGEHMASAALVGRFYERLGDHAVNIAGRVCYLATGRPQRSRG